MRPLLALAVTLAAAALAAPAAGAKPVRYDNFHSPTRLISCSVVQGRAELECFAPYLRDIGPLDTYLGLRSRGRAFISERGDFPGYPTRPRTLRYGRVWLRFGVRCVMRRTGLTCRNRSHRGFHVQRGRTYRF